MKVSFIYPVWLMGGVETYTLMLIKHIPDCEFEICLFADRHTYPPWVKLAENLGVKFVEKTSGIRVVWGGVKEGDIKVSHGFGDWTKNWIGKATGLNVAVSAHAGEVFGSEKFVNIGQGVDFDRVTPSGVDVRQLAGISKYETLAGYIGRFSSEKNLEVLTKCKTKVLYHGQGHQSVGILSVGPEVRVGDTLAAIDVLVYPSKEEGGPLAVLEAWAAGVPVVCNKVGIVQEFEETYGPLTVRMTEDIDNDVNRALSVPHQVIVEKARKLMWNYSAAALGRRWYELLRSL